MTDTQSIEAVCAGLADEVLDRVGEAIVRAGCPSREGPYGGYDYGYCREDDLPKGGRYVVRDFRDPRSDTWGAWVHQTPDKDVHEAVFHRMTRRHIAQAAIAAFLQQQDTAGKEGE